MSTYALIALSASLLAPGDGETEARAPYVPVAYRRTEEAAGDEVVRLKLAEGQSQDDDPAQNSSRRGYLSRGLVAGKDRQPMGFHIEARTGWDRLPLGAEGDDERSDGLLYGLGVGYDRKIGRAFFGIFAAIDGSTAERSGQVATSPDPLTGEVYETAFETEAGMDIELGLRGGWWLTDSWNVYGSAAWSRLDVDLSSETVVITPLLGGGTAISDPLIEDRGTTADGLRLGAGTEATLAGGIYAKAEYRYTTYDEDEAGADSDRSQIVTGVGLRF